MVSQSEKQASKSGCCDKNVINSRADGHPFIAPGLIFLPLEGRKAKAMFQLIERGAIWCFLRAAFMASINALVFSSRGRTYVGSI